MDGNLKTLQNKDMESITMMDGVMEGGTMAESKSVPINPRIDGSLREQLVQFVKSGGRPRGPSWKKPSRRFLGGHVL